MIFGKLDTEGKILNQDLVNSENTECRSSGSQVVENSNIIWINNKNFLVRSWSFSNLFSLLEKVALTVESPETMKNIIPVEIKH